MKKILSLLLSLFIIFSIFTLSISATGTEDKEPTTGTEQNEDPPSSKPTDDKPSTNPGDEDKPSSKPTDDNTTSKPADEDKPSSNPTDEDTTTSKPSDDNTASNPTDDNTTSKPGDTNTPSNEPENENSSTNNDKDKNLSSSTTKPVENQTTTGTTNKNGSVEDNDLTLPSKDSSTDTKTDTDDSNSKDKDSDQERSDTLPEEMSIYIKSVITEKDGTKKITLSIGYPKYKSYKISSATVTTASGTETVDLDYTINGGKNEDSECSFNVKNLAGTVTSVTIIIDEVIGGDADTAYAGCVTINVSRQTIMTQKQPMSSKKILSIILYILLGLIVVERIICAIVLFCNYKKDKMKRIWPWFVFLGGLWVFLLYFVIISQFNIGDIDDIDDDDIDFKDPDKYTQIPEVKTINKKASENNINTQTKNTSTKTLPRRRHTSMEELEDEEFEEDNNN